MDRKKIQQELCIMINHYIREKNPDIYSKLRDFYIQNHIFSGDEQNIDSILDLRYSDFPENQFLLFLKTLTPKDDFPSLFRRMTPFEKSKEIILSKCHLNLLCSNQFHTDSIFSIELDPLSRFLVTGSDDKTMKIISLPFFKEIFTFCGHNDVISNLNINYDISLLLSSSHDSTVRIWSLNNGKCLSVLSNITTSDIHYALFSPNGKFIAAACEDGSLFIWRTEDALEQKPPYYQYKSPELTPIVWLSFSPGSEFLCHVAEQNRVTILCLSNNKSFELRPLSGNITYVSFSRRLYPSSIGQAPKVVTFSAEEGTLSVFGVKNSSFSLLHVFRPTSSGKKGIICSMCWDFDDHLAVVVRQTSIVVYDTISGKTVSQLPEIEVVTGCYLIAANPKWTNLYVFVSANAMFTVWDIHEIELLASYTDKEEVLFHEVKWSPCGRFILAADHIGRVLYFCFTMDGHKCSLINVSNSSNFVSDDYYRLKKSSDNFLNFQVKSDLNFALKCQSEELELANRIEVNADNEAGAQNRAHSIVFQQLPDPISIIYRKPLNPTVLKPDDDPSFFRNINDETKDQQPLLRSNREEGKNNNDSVNNENDDLKNIAFDSEGELLPVLPPSDSSQFVLYEPFTSIDKPYWLIATSALAFVPQKGDQVLYIHAANHYDIISPPISEFTFPSLLRCQIKDIQLQSNENDELLIVDLEAPFLENSLDFQISYRFNDFCDYLIPITAMASYVYPVKNLEHGSHIEFRFDGYRCTGDVISIRPDYQSNPYESITVSGLDETVNISPWQILQYNETISTNPYEKKKILEVAAKAIESISQKNEFECFYDMSKEIQENKENIDFPVDMKFIIERLSHGWYRNSIGLKDDINKLKQVVKIIYDGQNDIIQLCDNMSAQCFDLLQRNVIRI